ncbi:unnamed protein product [Amaranthus hypochondriacus]
MEGQGQLVIYGEPFNQNNLQVVEKEDSGSDNSEDFPEGPSQNQNNNNDQRTKKCTRHTPQQIQELENFFSICAHPNEAQRLEFGRKLGLDSKQVKFWFQNRRTQLKSQKERHENVVLKQEYDKIMHENIVLKDAISNPFCQICGAPNFPREISMGQHNLRVEIDRLKDELTRVCSAAEKLLGKPITDYIGPISVLTPSFNLDLSMGRGEMNGLMSPPSPLLITMGPNIETGGPSNTSLTACSDYEKSVYMQAAMAAMDEVLALAQTDSPLWYKGLHGDKEVLIHDEYMKKFAGSFGKKPCGFKTDASRETGSVLISGLELVEIMMDASRWQDTFPCMISKAAFEELVCSGVGGTRDGELQLLNAEFIFPSPLVPFRQEKILRYCKQHLGGMWTVVDISVDLIRESLFEGSCVKWRRLPSGCIIHDVGHGYSMVTWIEHVEYDEKYIHQLYRSLLRSGKAFGSQKWLATLQRERDGAAVFMSAKTFPGDKTVGIVTPEGKKSVLKLMRRLSNNFCAGLCGASACRWEKLQAGGLAADLCVMSRVGLNEPGEPSGVVLSASTSIWVPVPRQDLFDFLRDEKLRAEWDILADGGPLEVISRLFKSHDENNCVSILCPQATSAKESNMLILQESWTDRTGSFIVYGPVDSASIWSVLRGEDSDFVILLPSGFVISDAPMVGDLPSLANDNKTGVASALTVGFQIMVNNLPNSNLTRESINTVNDLMSCTIKKIRLSLGI